MNYWVKVPFLHEQVESLVNIIATAVSKPEDHTRMIVSIILAYPMGWFMNIFLTKGGWVRNLYSLVTGFLLQNYMFRETTFHVYAYSLGGFLIMRLFPRAWQHWVMMVFLLIYMSSQHIYSMLNDFGGFHMDITTYTMILVCKLWILAWEYKDGGEDLKNLS